MKEIKEIDDFGVDPVGDNSVLNKINKKNLHIVRCWWKNASALLCDLQKGFQFIHTQI